MSDAYHRVHSGQGPTNALNKAEQFEDEKRRIIHSCFSKTDTDGALLESYITHCRVMEDASSPSEPPSTESSQDSKKQRVILLAVRKSGRVRMHKARENANGSFSIGKTWNLDDLQTVTNYGPPHDKGFAVTIVKPYYWQANSGKEKTFFITSILKIFMKYTSGKVPDMVGFDRVELEKFLGPGGAQLVDTQKRESETKNIMTSSGSTLKSMASTSSLNPSRSHRIPSATSTGRRSEDSSRHRSTSRPPPIPDDERQLRRQASRDAGSLNSRKSREQLRDDASSRSYDTAPMPPLAGSLGKKKSSKDVAAQFKLAANVSGVVGARSRPKTPTTPTTSTSMSRQASLQPLTPDIPPVNYVNDRRRKSEEESRRARSSSRGSRGNSEPQAPGMAEPVPPMPQEPPTRSDRRVPSNRSMSNDASMRREELSSQLSPEPIPPPSRGSDYSSPPGPVPPLKPLALAPTKMLSSQTSPNLSPITPTIAVDYRDQLRSPLQESLTSPPPAAMIRARSPVMPTVEPHCDPIALQSEYLRGLDMSTLRLNVEELLEEFDWKWRGKIDTLEGSVKMQLAKTESGNVMIDTTADERIGTLSALLDGAIRECESMDSLLTLYAVELTSMNDDITHIENQSQGLQVQTANQKALQTEVQILLERRVADGVCGEVSWGEI